LSHLEEIMLTEGLSGPTVSDRATRLNCSRRTLYESAPIKDAAVLNALRVLFARIREDALSATSSRASFNERLHDYLQVGVRAAQRMSGQAVADIRRWEPAFQVWKAHIALRGWGFCALLEAGIQDGAFCRVKLVLVGEFVFAGLSRMLEPEFYANTRISVTEAFQEYTALLPAALTPEASC
jgi:AcrR family transcriptional regulator